MPSIAGRPVERYKLATKWESAGGLFQTVLPPVGFGYAAVVATNAIATMTE